MGKKEEKSSGKFDLLKNANKKRILDVIMEREPVAKSEIVNVTGFTMPTVTRITDEFIKDGLVKTVGKGDSTGGRKPVLLSLNLDEYYFVGVYVSRTIRSIVTNIRGEVIAGSQRDLPGGMDTEQAVGEIKKCMEESVENARVGSEKIAYAGIGVPGTGFKNISRKQELLFYPWVNTNYRELYQIGNFPYPTVFANAVRMGAVGELKFGIGKQMKNFLYIHIGDGVGMGAVVDGVLQSGAQQVGGEFGHTSINYGGPLCYCGNRGCVEAYCAVDALLREYAAECAANPEKTPDSQINLKELAEAVRENDKTACRAVERVAALLGIGVGNVVNLYNPEAVVFGGEISTSIPSYVKRAVEEAKKHIFINEARKVQFYVTEIKEQSEILGAAANAIQNFLEAYCEK